MGNNVLKYDIKSLEGHSLVGNPTQSFTSPFDPTHAAAICHMALFGWFAVG